MSGRYAEAGSTGTTPDDSPGIAFRPLDDAEVAGAGIAAAATGAGTVAAGALLLAAARQDPETELFGGFVAGALVAVYALRNLPMAREIAHLAVAPESRHRGHGRACLDDARRRAGNRPLVVETDQDALDFYRAAGFKLVGKRRHPSGTVRYRLGWHAPSSPHVDVHSPLTVRSSPSLGREAGSAACRPASLEKPG